MAANHAINSETRRRAKFPRVSARSTRRQRPGTGASSRPKSATIWSPRLTVWGANAPCRSSATGPIASKLENCRPPLRPQGLERNVVITQWDWSGPKEYFHDEISTDRRNPTMNANGLVYGVHEDSSDFMTVLDPVKNTMSQIAIPFKPGTPMAEPPEVLMPSPYWGTETVAISHATAHSLMMDSQGRIWTAAATRDRDNPAFCKQGSTHPSAIAFPLEKSSRQTNVYDP